MLSDMKILDFTSLLPGPFATMMLGDMGAKIICVEAPNRLNLVKVMDPQVGDASALYQALNRNKKIIELDLKDSTDIDKIMSMIEEYDIIIEGFRPGVMKKFGLDYESLKEKNDKIIYCSLTGYGQDGPYAQRAGHDINYLALSGIPAYSGNPTGRPVLDGIQIADLAGGSLHAVIAIQAAFIHRQKTGIGQHLDVAMYDASFSLSIFETVSYLASGVIPKSNSGMLNGGSIYDYYETLDQRYLSIGSLEPKFQKQLFQILEIDVADKTVKDVKKLIQESVSVRTLDYWIKQFSEFDACVEPVLNLDEAMNHPQFVERKIIQTLKVSDNSDVKFINHPIKYSEYKSNAEPFIRQ
ncbi:MAG: CoA transferase [Candidatus Heimdallarchaeota archaeon]|nr:CoA transferase [Candidatus Heimdallarchaeota archaeon]